MFISCIINIGSNLLFLIYRVFKQSKNDHACVTLTTPKAYGHSKYWLLENEVFPSKLVGPVSARTVRGNSN